MQSHGPDAWPGRLSRLSLLDQAACAKLNYDEYSVGQASALGEIAKARRFSFGFRPVDSQVLGDSQLSSCIGL